MAPLKHTPMPNTWESLRQRYSKWQEPPKPSSKLQSMISKYSVKTSGPSKPATIEDPTLFSPSVILLTGTTGALGSELLSLYLKSSKVKKLYAFNRASKAPTTDRQRRMFIKRKLDVSLLDSPNLFFVDGDLASSLLGLERGLYKEILSSVTLIIHNAWPTTLSKPVSYFEPNIQGTKSLLEFALKSPNPTALRFFFISSTLASLAWPLANGPVPESLLPVEESFRDVGYGQSKLISEWIVSNSGLPSCILRIGQLSGTRTSGIWPTREWLPLAVNLCLNAGAFPDISGTTSWLPMDIAARVVLELSFVTQALPPVINVVHPRPWSMKEFTQAFFTAVHDLVPNRPQPLRLVTAEEWASWLLASSSRSEQTSTSSHKISFIQIVLSCLVREPELRKLERGAEHFGTPTATMEHARTYAPFLDSVQPLSISDVRQWLDYWVEVGFITEKHLKGMVEPKL